ncbi:MAG TPA: sugar ABC transporter permease [Firmicutes bacterium]|nr:sugar ABC transporter permease [Bacillota bacterium]HHY98587.1 sugar ABC transporter permease [Bacillota bacterium]
MKTHLSHMARREEAAFYLFISPWLIGFIAFTAGPIVASLFFSFCNYDIVNPPQWIWLGNFAKLLSDPLFWQSLKVTAIYSFFGVPLDMMASLAIALLLNQKVRGLAWFRTIFYMPSVISGVAVSLLWMWIFNPEFGILNYLLWILFRIHGPAWIMSEEWVLPALIIMSLWGIGGGIVIYLAGLQGVPTELYEAAEIDGATPWNKLMRITLPMMSPVILFNLIMGIIGSFQVFTQAYVMTGGGPHYASLFYVLYIYQNAFQFFSMGYASALAWILFLIILALTLLVFKSSPLWVYYEGTARGR